MSQRVFHAAMAVALVGLCLIGTGCSMFMPPQGPQSQASGEIVFADTGQKFHAHTVRDYDNKGLSQSVQYMFELDQAAGKWKLIGSSAAAQQGFLKTIGEQILPAFAELSKGFIMGPLMASFMPATNISFNPSMKGGDVMQSQSSYIRFLQGLK
jgi:hypothetical protein